MAQHDEHDDGKPTGKPIGETIRHAASTVADAVGDASTGFHTDERDAADERLERLVGTGRRTTRELALSTPASPGFRFKPLTMQNQPFTVPAAGARRPPIRLVVCADGTWNAPEKQGGTERPTNVWLTYQLVSQRADDGRLQLAYYHAGVGSSNPLDRMLGALGYGLSRNVVDCYRFLVDHYQPGDAIYLFGFSRGAYTARSLAGLVRNCGIVSRDKVPPAERERRIGDAYALYRDRGDESAPVARRSVAFRRAHSHTPVRIACVGVWDTVGALGIPLGLAGRLSRMKWGFHDVTLSSWVECALHAIAIDERRAPYLPTLWEQQADARADGQVMEQVWFSGAHSDVGGGYAWAERELANVSLRWMLNRVTAHCRLEFDDDLLGRAPRAAAAIHDEARGFWRSVVTDRVIDAGLDAEGTREGRHTAESVHPSVSFWCDQFGQTPMPKVGRPYGPANQADYLARLQKVPATPPAPPPSFDSDRRRPPPAADAPPARQAALTPVETP